MISNKNSVENSSKNSIKNSIKNSNKNNNRLRIIGGDLRGRIIKFADVKSNIALRPTPDRVRETLFNWLGQNLDNCKCLDLFAGSGVLSFESLSRHAAQVIINDNNKTIIKNIQQNLQLLNLVNIESNKVEIYNLDALLLLKMLGKQSKIFDVIFIDPPYNKNIIQQIFLQNTTAQILSKICHKNTHIYIEAEQKIIDENNSFELVKYLKAGEVHSHVFIPKNCN